MSRRGPYRKLTKLSVKEAKWLIGDVVQVGAVRWMIRRLSGNDVLLVASNASPAIRWSTTLDRLPKKTPRK